MDKPGDLVSRPAGASLGNWLKVGVPLAIGISLIITFIVLLQEVRKQEGEAVGTVDGSMEKGVPAQSLPKEEPIHPDLTFNARNPPLPPGPNRWNLDHFPEGWDPALASKIAEFFAKMDIRDPSDLEWLKSLAGSREAFQAFLDKLGPEAIPTLGAILGAEVDFVHRRFLIRTLGRLGQASEEATFPLLEFYKRCRDRMDARSELGHVIEALGEMKNQTAFQEISREIDDPDTIDEYRDKFIQALGKHPRAQEALPKFHAWLEYGDDANIRNHSAQAIGNLGSPRSLDYLVSRFEREPQWIVQQTILGSIGKIGDPGALPFLENVARNNPQSDVRLSAGRAIWRIGTPQAFEILGSLADGEGHDGNRKNFLEWLNETPPSAGSGKKK